MAKIAFYFILISLLVTSCYITSTVSIDVLQPAKTTLPNHAQTLALINRASFPPAGSGSQQIGIKSITPQVLDSLASEEYLKGLAHVLTSSPRYAFLSPINLSSKHNTIPPPLSYAQFTTITDTTEADGILSVDYFKVKDTLWVEWSPSYYSYQSVLRFINTSLWRFYSLNEQNFTNSEFVHNDTIYWNSYGASSDELLEGLPDKIASLMESNYTAGENIALTFAPIWTSTTRKYYYGGSGAFSQATRFVESNQWDKADSLWRGVALSKNKLAASNASYNVALICEMNDDLVGALEWARKSYFLKPRLTTINYVEILKERVEKKELLLKQL